MVAWAFEGVHRFKRHGTVDWTFLCRRALDMGLRNCEYGMHPRSFSVPLLLVRGLGG
jgi:hypothetical protein